MDVLMPAACEAAERACGVAARAARSDAVGARMRLPTASEELERMNAAVASARRRLYWLRLLPFLARGWEANLSTLTERQVSLRATVAALRTSGDRHEREARVADEVRRGFLALREGFPRALPGDSDPGPSRIARSVRSRSDFAARNLLHLTGRRREALTTMRVMLGEAQEAVRLALERTVPLSSPTSVAPSPRSGVTPSADPRRAVGSAAGQIVMDFSGAGKHETVSRVWLPVPYSRNREMVALGARYDPEGPKRGSRLWVPLNEKARFDSVLPLAYRSEPTRFSYPPIRAGAVMQNLGKVFEREGWNRLRTDAYDRSGHRCQICGSQHGKMWSRISGEADRNTSGPVDCHEVWDWQVENTDSGTGVQRLRRLLVLCKDCHMTFHEGFALHKARQVGLEDRVGAHIDKIRMLVNGLPLTEIREGVALDHAEWEANRSVSTWVLDLSHVAAQDVMHDHVLDLTPNNPAGVTPDMVGGTEFTFQGTRYESVPAAELAAGGRARPADGPRIRRA